MKTDKHTLSEWFDHRVTFSGEKTALVFGEVTFTYLQMKERIGKLAAVLHAQGVTKGSTVGFLAFNHPDILMTMFAAASLGAIFVPLNFRLTSAELDFLIKDAEIHTLLVGSEHVPLIASIAAQLPCRHYVQQGRAHPSWPSLEDLLAEAREPAPAVAVSSADVAVMFYTSGTTGRSKGAMLTHANLWANNLNWVLAFAIGPEDVLLTTAPMFHVSGIFVLLSAVLFAGGRVVLHRAFDPEATLRTFQEQKVTLNFAVPTMILGLVQSPSFATTDLSSLRSVIVGGAPTPESLLRRAQEGGIPVSHNYGMTEAVSAVTYLEAHMATEKINSVGRPMILAETRILGEDGAYITAPHVKGELCLRGDQVFAGYWKRPEANAAAFLPDGFFRSGDVAYSDADGFLYVCDRVKDMIISGGENIYPAEIESVILEMPVVANAAVIGLPDEKWGERVVAVVVLKPGATLTLDQLLAFCADKLGRYKLPRELRITPELPLNGAGKILKQALRQAQGNPS